MDGMSANIGALAESVSEIVPKLQGLINALSNDKEVADMQANLYTEISKIDSLTAIQCIKATNMLAEKPSLMRVFYAMLDEVKMQYIMNMLQNDA